jgi:hypothetical protein
VDATAGGAERTSADFEPEFETTPMMRPTTKAAMKARVFPTQRRFFGGGGSGTMAVG